MRADVLGNAPSDLSAGISDLQRVPNPSRLAPDLQLESPFPAGALNLAQLAMNRWSKRKKSRGTATRSGGLIELRATLSDKAQSNGCFGHVGWTEEPAELPPRRGLAFSLVGPVEAPWEGSAPRC